jgi:hypothetical protein
MFDLTPFRPGAKIDPYTLEVEFDRAFSDSTIALREVYELWRDFFADNQGTYARITGYPLHWELFVRATWELFLSLPEADVMVHVKWQIPTAFRLDVGLEQNLFLFLYRRYVTVRDIEVAYRLMRQTIMESSVPLNPAQKGSVSIRDLMEQRKKNYRQDVSIDDSTTLARIENELFPVGSNRSDAVEAEKIIATRAFLSFVDFIRNNEVIAPIVSQFIIARMESFPVSQDEREIERTDTTSTNTNALSLNNSVPPQMPPVTIPSDEEEIDSRMTYAEIRASIDHRFGRDEMGNYRNMEGVLATLESFAEKYNDERIRELFYFDEDRESFMWNDELLAA